MVMIVRPLLLACVFIAINMLIPKTVISSRAQSTSTASTAQEPLPDAPSHVPVSRAAKPAAHDSTRHSSPSDAPWPREADHGDETISMYQPQLESWGADELHAYAALAAVNKKDKKAKYGAVWFTARTEIDKVNRQVTLDKFQITKVQFPTMKNKEAEYQAFLQAKLPGKSKIIALDRLEAELVAAESEESRIQSFPVNNEPPKVIFTTKPAMLVLIDGPAKFRDLGGTDLRLLLNSKSTVIADTKKSKCYLNVMDGWMEASDLEGPWTYAPKIPDEMEEITKGIQERQKERAPEGKAPPSLKAAKKDGKIPAIFVSFGPAELLVTEGAPQLDSFQGLGLQYVKNTSANVFREVTSNDYYILLAGRWFRSKSLENGPWQFVDAQSLPKDFAKIPEDHSKAGVLASVPGTGPAKEALIANSIPQTATISRGEAHIEVKYDGEPQFKAIEGTPLQYAVNSATPVIRVDANGYYAVENAVWFVAQSAQGPWAVATSVPDVIYTIPPNASLHYVTYVKIYRSTPEAVYVGYTPGYYGSVVSSSTTTVVYGTGWYYPPYIGNYWYGAPYTYGAGVATTWSLGEGWSLTFGVSYGYGYGYPYYYYPWWGPWGYYGGCCWGPAWGSGYGGYASANVYGRWGNTAYAGTRAAWANPHTGNVGAVRGAAGYNANTGIIAGAAGGYAGNAYSGQGAAGRGAFAYNTNTGAGVAAGRNNVYAGKDGTVYRYDRQNGNWSQNSGNGWQSTSRSQSLQQQQQARSIGQMRTQNFSSMGGMRGGMGGGRRR